MDREGKGKLCPKCIEKRFGNSASKTHESYPISVLDGKVLLLLLLLFLLMLLLLFANSIARITLYIMSKVNQ